MPTGMTTFRAGVELVNLDERAPIPVGFIFQLTDEFTPAHVTNGFGKAMVLDHILDRETLDAYHLVLANQPRRELVLIVPAPSSNLGMDTGHF